jgi:2-deoxy-D-gluconate 3-dehydrogenase
MNTKRFENKVAIVTGASRGIGQGIALAFAREGAHVVSVDIGDQTETGQKAKALGAKFNAYTEDFGKLTKRRRRTHRQNHRRRRPRGHPRQQRRHHPPRAHRGSSRSRLERAAANQSVRAVFPVAGRRQMVGHRRTRKIPGGRALKVVNIASMLSFQGGIFVPGYTAAKSGIAGITKAFANELAKERCNFNAIAPGYVATENTRPLREDEKHAARGRLAARASGHQPPDRLDLAAGDAA